MPQQRQAMIARPSAKHAAVQQLQAMIAARFPGSPTSDQPRIRGSLANPDSSQVEWQRPTRGPTVGSSGMSFATKLNFHYGSKSPCGSGQSVVHAQDQM